MTHRTQPHHNRPSSSLAYLAALDLSSDDLLRPALCNVAILAGRACRSATSDERTEKSRAVQSE